MTVTILKENVEYPEYHLDNPNGLTKGYYLSKCKEDVLYLSLNPVLSVIQQIIILI